MGRERGGGCVDGAMEGRFWGEEGEMLLWRGLFFGALRQEYRVILDLEISGTTKDLSGLGEAAIPCFIRLALIRLWR